MTRPVMFFALLALLLLSAAVVAQAPPAPDRGSDVVGEPMYMLVYRSPVVAVCVITEGNDVAPAENEPAADKPAAKTPLRPTATCKVVRRLAGVDDGDELTLSVGVAAGRRTPLILKQDEKWLLFMGVQRQGQYPVLRAAKVVDDRVTGFRVRESSYGLVITDGEMALEEALAAVTKAIDDHVVATKYDTSEEAKTADQLVADIGDNEELNLKIVGALGVRRACPQLLTLLKTPPAGPRLHITVIKALGQCPGEASEEALIGLLSSKDPSISGSAANSLADMKSKRALEPLLEIARTQTGILSYPLARALAATGDARAIEPLLEARKRIIAEEEKAEPTKKQPWLRVAYFRLLRGFDDPQVGEVAREELRSDDRAAVLLAAEILHERGDPAGTKRLLAMLEEDTSYANQSVIIATLARMKDETAVPGLIKLLAGSQDANIRAHAANALAQITGEKFGEDAARWQEWWDKRKG